MAGETEVGESRGEADATVTCLVPRVPNITIHDGGSAAEDNGGSLKEADRRKRDVIRRAPNCSFHVYLCLSSYYLNHIELWISLLYI